MSRQSHYIVIEADARALSLCRAARDGDSVQILAAASFAARTRDDNTCALLDQNAVDEAVAHIAECGWAGDEALILVTGEQAAYCQLPMPPLKGAALDKAVLLKLGQQLHFPLDNAVVELDRAPKRDVAPDGSRMVAAAVLQRNVAMAAVDVARRAGLRLRACTLSTAALAALALDRQKPGAEGLDAFLILGERTSVFLVFSGRTTMLTTELPLGLRDFAAALMRPIINGDQVVHLDEEQAVAVRDRVGIPDPEEVIPEAGVPGQRLFPLLEPTLQRLVQLLTQWLSFMATQSSGAKIRSLWLAGRAASMPRLDATISQRLRIEVRPCPSRLWPVSLAGAAARLNVDDFLVHGAAVRHVVRLPNMVPRDVRRKWAVRRVRRSTAIVGPIAAAAIFGVAILFDQLGMKVDAAQANDLSRWKSLRELIEWNQSAGAVKTEVSDMEQRLHSFAANDPHWEGLFKELSRILPAELAISILRTSDRPGQMRLIMEARVYGIQAGADFNAIVEAAQRALQDSPFFESVQLISSNQNLSPSQHRPELGTLAVELNVACGAGPAAGKGAPQ